MKCAICRTGELADGTTTVTLTPGETIVVVKQVPARICDNCGEEYFDEDVTEALLRLSEELAAAGVEVAVREYAAA